MMQTESFRADYIAARVDVLKASAFSARYAAETVAAKIVDDAEKAGIDLLPELMELEDAAMVAFYGTLKEWELRDLLSMPWARSMARAELNRRAA